MAPFIVPGPLRHFARAALDLILPPHSLVTGQIRTNEDGSSWSQIRFLDEPCCDACGLPFDYDIAAESLCGDCSAKPPVFDHARTAFVYDDASRRLVLSFKHGGRTDGLEMFTAQMARAGRRFLPKADFLIPVPLHRTRLIKRRFNQSALLARKLAKITAPTFEPDILFRKKATPSQGSQSYKGRFRNVSGAFHVPEVAKVKLSGKHVILIDDVLTTVATLQSCARTLKRAGASHIDVITLACTLRERRAEFGDKNGQS